MKIFAVLAVPVLVILATIGITLYASGLSAGYREASEKRIEELREAHASHCCPGDSEPCVFGPGIVGVKNCIKTTWDKCAPDPRYRTQEPSK